MPEIIVEFVPDYSKLESGINKLTSEGQISKEFATLFNSAQKPVDDLAKKVEGGRRSISGSLTAISRSVKSVAKDMIEGFKEGMGDALKEAGVSVKEFDDALKKATSTEKSLKQELRETTEALAKMKLEGKENTKEYEELIKKAGQYRDTLSDVAAETRRVGSDTRKIDTVIEIVQGLGAAYQIAQGAAALLGKDNEQLQAGLLRLQAIMAVTTGIQQVANLLQKESNAIRFVTNLQLKAQVAATNLQTAAQSKNVIVSGLATIAMKALNVVMRANPAVLLISAFAALAAGLAFFSGSAKRAKEEVELLNLALEHQKNLLDDTLSSTDFETDIAIEKAKQRGASEKEVQDIRSEGIAKNLRLIQQENEARARQFAGEIKNADVNLLKLKEVQAERFRLSLIDAQLGKGKNEQLQKELLLLDTQIEGLKKFQELARQAGQQSEGFNTDQAEKARQKQKEAQDKAEADAKKFAEDARQRELQRLTDVKSRIEATLLSEREGTEAFLKLQVDLAQAEKNIGIFNAKSLAEKNLAIANFLKKVDDITTEFYVNQEKKAIEAQISTLNAQLTNINLEFEQREQLTVALLERQRQLELAEVNLTKEKIKEINAKFDHEIAEQTLSIRRTAFEQEIRLESAQGGARQRFLQATADNEKKKAEERLNALDELAAKEIALIQRKDIENKRSFTDQLISLQEFNAVTAELKDEELKIHQDTELKKTKITEDESKKREEKTKEEILKVIAVATEVGQTLGAIFQTVNEQQSNEIANNRKQLDDLLAAGAITEKQFEDRSRRLDFADRNAKRRQAEREKGLQLFQAFISGARAIVEAAPNPFLIALTAVLVGAQIAAIAARPIPKFGKGTKRAPKGLAEIGETGPEIVQTDKGYFLAEHPQVVWLKGGEQIYNPHDTKTILKSRTPKADGSLTENYINGSTLSINEDSLAKKIGDQLAKYPRNNISLDKNGFTHFVQDALSKTKYNNSQYTFND